MALYFPPSPSDGEEVTINGIVYTYDDNEGVWNSGVSASGISYTKAEADARFVNVAGDAMTDVLSMGNSNIQNLKDPVGPLDAANKKSVEEEADKKVDKKGDTMTGILTMSDNQILEVGDPIDPTDAVNKKYVDDGDDKLEDEKVAKSGDTMDGNLFLMDGAGKPLGLTSPAHAVHKQYVDIEITNKLSAGVKYHGVVDASLIGPTSIPIETGDFYIQENADGSGDPVTIDAVWGFPAGTQVTDLTRILYNGTDWEFLHVNNGGGGDFVSKIGGDSMEGPLVINSRPGDSDGRVNNKISTYGIYSPNTSNLQLGVNSGGGSGVGLTKMYVGNSDVDVLVPIKVSELTNRAGNTGIRYTGATTDPKHIVTKEVLDDYFDNIIGEFTYKYLGNAEAPGLMVDFVNNSPADPKTVSWIALCETDKQGKPLTSNDFRVDQYLHFQTAKGDAYYKVTSALWDSASALLTNPGWELRLEWVIGDGFTFDLDDEILIESGNIAALVDFFAANDDPTFTGTVTLDGAKIIQDWSGVTSTLNELYKFKPLANDDTTNSFVFQNAGGTQIATIDLQGNTSSNRFQIRGKGNGREALLEFRADSNLEVFTNIKLKTGTWSGAVQPRITGLADPIDDNDAVNLGFVTDKLQEKFEDLIGQSAQGSYNSSTAVIPTPGTYTAFNASHNHINTNDFDPADIADLSFHATDKDSRTVDYSVLEVGDFIVLSFGTSDIVRFRVETKPVPHTSYPAYDIDVSYVTGGDGVVSKDDVASVQFQRIGGGTVDLTDYVKKDGTTVMTGPVQVNVASGTTLEFKQSGSTKLKITANGTIDAKGKFNLDSQLDFGSNDKGIKVNDQFRLQFSSSTTGGTIYAARPGDTRQGFTLQGETRPEFVGMGGENKLFNIYHGDGANPDTVYYRGSQDVSDSLATMANVNDKLPLDGSEEMTGNLGITIDPSQNSAAAINLTGSRPNNGNNVAVISFKNKETANVNTIGYFGYKSDGSDVSNDYFTFTKNIDMGDNGLHSVGRIRLTGGKEICEGNTARVKFDNKVVFTRIGDNKNGFTIQGKSVGGSGVSTGNLLSAYHNSGTGGDAINYTGKTTETTNIQTKNSVEKMLESAFPYKITETGGQFFIEPN